ncbi:unnamed protein product, partial [Hydatigera taeniaeformis]|uniref:Uncharacterized protein n=1 Tax=Hydatigena taeniaeformis TaxID=6205 RepID=A0A0R3WW75_HYDTA
MGRCGGATSHQRRSIVYDNNKSFVSSPPPPPTPPHPTPFVRCSHLVLRPTEERSAVSLTTWLRLLRQILSAFLATSKSTLGVVGTEFEPNTAS